MNKKKLIGIPAWDIKPGEHFGVTIPYLMWAEQFGTVVFLTPDYQPEIDLVILPGGADVDTLRYNETPSYTTSRPNHYLELFDKVSLPVYVERKTPIFGICRGLQTLNVHFGGSLKQNLLYHETSSSTNDVDVHSVFTARNSGGELVKGGKSLFKVGSWHHQSADRIGKNLVIDLVSDDLEVEALYHKELPFAAVQWHPERVWDDYSKQRVLNLLKK